MLTELLNNVNSDIARGMAQAAGAIVLCLAVVGLCRQFAVHVERETAISIARGLVQMVFVGIVLAALLHGSLLVGAMILLAMTFAAAVTASRRARGIRGSLLLSFYAIAAGAGVVIAGMNPGKIRQSSRAYSAAAFAVRPWAIAEHSAITAEERAIALVK